MDIKKQLTDLTDAIAYLGSVLEERQDNITTCDLCRKVVHNRDYEVHEDEKIKSFVLICNECIRRHKK